MMMNHFLDYDTEEVLRNISEFAFRSGGKVFSIQYQGNKVSYVFHNDIGVVERSFAFGVFGREIPKSMFRETF
jgi:hypothetical protein